MTPTKIGPTTTKVLAVLREFTQFRQHIDALAMEIYTRQDPDCSTLLAALDTRLQEILLQSIEESTRGYTSLTEI